MSVAQIRPVVTEAHQAQFTQDGYFILERVIPDEIVEMLRAELTAGIARIEAEMDAQGTDSIGINHRGKRYFIANSLPVAPRLGEFVFSDLTAEICRATLGEEAWLFLEQYVVKLAEVGTTFAWHQDSGYLKSILPEYTTPYLSLWCALDDMTEENGTIYVLPYSRAGTNEVIDHVQEQGSNDLVGYFGDDPGDPVIVPAGSIAVFSSTLLHRSGFNRTDKPRRSYLVQYSPELVPVAEGSVPAGQSRPFLKGGVRVDDPQP